MEPNNTNSEHFFDFMGKNEMEVYKSILIAQIDTFFLFDPSTGKAILWNNSFCKISGFTDEEISELPTPKSYFSESDIERAIPFIEKVKKEGSGKIELDLICKNGKKIPFEYQVSEVECGRENIKCLLSIGREISDRKIAENELMQKNIFIDKIIESSAVSTWISDENGTAIQTNPACLKFFGATNEEVIGKYNVFKDEVLIKAGYINDVKEVFEKGVVKNISFDYNFAEVNHVEVKNATHKYINTIFTPIVNNKGVVENVIVQTFDLTEIKSVENELRHSEERIKSLINNLDSGVVVHAPDSSIVFNNERASELLGLGKEQMIGKKASNPVWKLIYENNSPIPLEMYPVNQVVTSKSHLTNMVLGVVKPDKKDIVWLLVNGMPFFDLQGNLKEIIVSFNDITELKKADDKLKTQHEQLEKLVQERTSELEEKNKELDKTLKVFVGRELQIRELQNQIKKLKGE